MKNLMEEILETTINHGENAYTSSYRGKTSRRKAANKSDRSNCSCIHSHQGRLKEISFLDELLFELSGSALNSAVVFNRSKRISIGWGKYFDEIVSKVLRLNMSPDEGTFASALADWQKNNGLTPDGKLGSASWSKIKKILKINDAKGSDSSRIEPKDVVNATSCASPSQLARDKCKNPGSKACAPIPDLLCMRGVNGIPFEYPHKLYWDSANRVNRVVNSKSQLYRQQRFIPETRNALIEFTKNMKRFGMPIKSIFTWGSYYCRCVSDSNTLSNHSFGEAIDIVGVRWENHQPFSRIEDTLITRRNLNNLEQRRLLIRMNACLRLSFNNVIDYHRDDHKNHFHCDMNRVRAGGKYVLDKKNAVNFIQECLSLLLKRSVKISGKLDTQTYAALSQVSGKRIDELKNATVLKNVYIYIFEKIAAGKF